MLGRNPRGDKILYSTVRASESAARCFVFTTHFPYCSHPRYTDGKKEK